MHYTLLTGRHTSSTLRQAIGADWKGKASLLLYAVASLWLVQGRRIEQQLRGEG